MKTNILRNITATSLASLLLLLGCWIGCVRAAGTVEVLTWHECLAETRKNSPELVSAAEDINQEKAAKDVTASSLYPQINTNLNAAATKTKSSGANESYSYGVTGTQLLFDGFKTANSVKSAAETVKAAREGYRFTSSNVRLSLRTAFVNLLKAQELVGVAEEIVKIRRDNLELITLRYQSGLEHRGALLTAEANLAAAESELSQARRDVELYQRELSKEMGRKEFRPLSVKGDFSARDQAKDKPDIEAIARNNPSLLQASARKNAAAFNIKSAYGSFSPQLSASAGADKTSTHWPPRESGWNTGLTVSLPLFEGGLRKAQLAQAQALYRQAEADERIIHDNTVIGLEEAWASLQDALENVEVQSKSLGAAVERSVIAEAQYSTGFITYDNWSIIEDNLVSAKKSYLNAQANVLFAEANWIKAKGETLEYVE